MLNKREESLNKLILVWQYKCDLGIGCIVDFVYQEDEDINEEDLCGVIKKLFSESHCPSIAFVFVCDTQNHEQLSGVLTKLIGQEHFDVHSEVAFVKEKIIFK